MQPALLDKYLHGLSKVKRAPTRYGTAPHKLVLLITITELFEKGLVSGNRICIDESLVGLFLENWKLLVRTDHQPDFKQPFWYMQNDRIGGQPFWFLTQKPGYDLDPKTSSINKIAVLTDHASLSEDLYSLMLNPVSRNTIRKFLLNTVFPESETLFDISKQTEGGYLHELEAYLLNEPKVRYRRVEPQTEEDVFVRNRMFKKLVPKVYDQTCSFTGMKLQTTFGHTLIDACHIVPFSISQDDKMSNGIALCPNMHRAFDRGLVTLDTDYRIIISQHVFEVADHAYSLKQLEGKPMHLPSSARCYPAAENVRWHRENVFKG
ncbi:restriction endonuclease [Pedobacter sp. HMF7647]|uniref:Restriction endonuclease n=1 Tax=Hufsiella arboris TaxID=2695275 RepID=A0A7K1Y5Q1_9SPHI|nr:HNH endonuclease [Hufsiella arboris]MXV49904.1 restriction endonuclease [Hufsiella arboris]